MQQWCHYGLKTCLVHHHLNLFLYLSVGSMWTAIDTEGWQSLNCGRMCPCVMCTWTLLCLNIFFIMEKTVTSTEYHHSPSYHVECIFFTAPLRDRPTQPFHLCASEEILWTVTRCQSGSSCFELVWNCFFY